MPICTLSKASTFAFGHLTLAGQLHPPKMVSAEPEISRNIKRTNGNNINDRTQRGTPPSFAEDDFCSLFSDPAADSGHAPLFATRRIVSAAAPWIAEKGELTSALFNLFANKVDSFTFCNRVVAVAGRMKPSDFHFFRSMRGLQIVVLTDCIHETILSMGVFKPTVGASSSSSSSSSCSVLDTSWIKKKQQAAPTLSLQQPLLLTHECLYPLLELPMVRILGLASCTISDATLINVVAKLHMLQELDLSGCPAAFHGRHSFPALAQGCPRLKTLNVSGAQLLDERPKPPRSTPPSRPAWWPQRLALSNDNDENINPKKKNDDDDTDGKPLLSSGWSFIRDIRSLRHLDASAIESITDTVLAEWSGKETAPSKLSMHPGNEFDPAFVTSYSTRSQRMELSWLRLSACKSIRCAGLQCLAQGGQTYINYFDLSHTNVWETTHLAGTGHATYFHSVRASLRDLQFLRRVDVVGFPEELIEMMMTLEFEMYEGDKQRLPRPTAAAPARVRPGAASFFLNTSSEEDDDDDVVNPDSMSLFG